MRPRPCGCGPGAAAGSSFTRPTCMARVDDDLAVIIEPAHPSRNAPLILSSLGLTPRESEIARLVLRGASTKAICAELHLSTYTVKDHLKSIFDKTGVRSRRDLVAQILTGRVPA